MAADENITPYAGGNRSAVLRAFSGFQRTGLSLCSSVLAAPQSTSPDLAQQILDVMVKIQGV
jgi:hypothetical protein